MKLGYFKIVALFCRHISVNGFNLFIKKIGSFIPKLNLFTKTRSAGFRKKYNSDQFHIFGLLLF